MLFPSHDQAGIAQGQAGLGQLQAGLGLQGISGLADLGQRFLSRELQGATFPLQQQFALANLLKSTAAAEQPGILDTITGVAGGAGAVLGPLAQGGIISDENVKKDIRDIKEELSEFVD